MMDACEHEFNEWENMGWYRLRVCVHCGVLDIDSIEPDYPDDLVEPDCPDDSEVDVLYGEALLKLPVVIFTTPIGFLGE